MEISLTLKKETKGKDAAQSGATFVTDKGGVTDSMKALIKECNDTMQSIIEARLGAQMEADVYYRSIISQTCTTVVIEGVEMEICTTTTINPTTTTNPK